MRALPLLLLVGACFESHVVEHTSDVGPDAGRDAASRDAGFTDDVSEAFDASFDTGPDAPLVFDVPVAGLEGARWGDQTTLALSFSTLDERPIELWTVDGVHEDLATTAWTVDGTEGARIAAASRWQSWVALAVEQPTGPHEVVIVDVEARSVITRFAPDPTLMRDRVFHAYLAIAERELLVIWLDPESIQRYRVVSFEGGDLSSGLAGSNDLSAAVRLASSDPQVDAILRRRLEDAFMTVDDRLEQRWVADSTSVAAFDRGLLFIDADEGSEPPRPVRVIYGRMAYARSGSSALMAMTTDSGLIAATLDPFGVTWHEVESRWPAGSAVAHLSARHRGFFVIEGAIGFMPARLRWVAL